MDHLEKLREAIKKNLNVSIEEDVLIASVTLFPALLVAYSDGNIDEREKEYLVLLADNYAFHNEEIEQENKEKFSDSLCSLLLSISDKIYFWQKEYIEALKYFLISDNTLKSEIEVLINNIARISDKISETEQKKIEWLKSELAF